MKSKLGINSIKILSLACAGTFYTNEIEVYVGKQIGEKIASPRQDVMNVECSYAESILQNSAQPVVSTTLKAEKRKRKIVSKAK